MKKFLIRLIEAFPAVWRFANRLVTNCLASSTPPRPHRFSLWSPSDATAPAPQKVVASKSNTGAKPTPAWVSDYTSWSGLVDRGFTGRHLPPRRDDDTRPLPDPAQIWEAFERKGEMVPSERSSVLFCFFAQWFTDSFLRTHPTDPRRTTSNHEIDLCQIYGLDETSTWALRQDEGGLLKSRQTGKGEFPAFLYKDQLLDPQFFDPASETGLTYLRAGRATKWEQALEGSLPDVTKDPDRRDWFYASGLDRGGSTLVYSAFNTIFLREHNRVARLLAKEYGHWDSDRIFETARLVNIRQLLGIVINDYIRHIGGLFPFMLDRTFAEKARWYRANRISIEFDLLYRWHSLIPDTLVLGGATLQQQEYRYNNRLLETHGIEAVLTAASKQKAGRVGLSNTPSFMQAADGHGLKWARDFKIAGFNDYRERFGLTRHKSIEALTSGGKDAAILDRLYGGDVEAVEFTVGLFAEGRGPEDVLSETMVRMVAFDAFTHILTNPVLASEVHCEATFSSVGWKIVNEGVTLAQLVARNTDRTKKPIVSLAA